MSQSVVKKIRQRQREHGTVRVVRSKYAQSWPEYLRRMKEQARESERLTEDDFSIRVNTRS